MNLQATESSNDNIESGYLLSELEFPEHPDSWALEDFQDLLPSSSFNDQADHLT